MATPARYSREDMADAVAEATAYANVGGFGRNGEFGLVRTDRLRKWAAIMSEAANRTPTHAELVEMIEAERS